MAEAQALKIESQGLSAGDLYLEKFYSVEKTLVGQRTSLNRAVADLVQFDKWNSAAIERRQEMLAALARKVWGIERAKPEVAG